MITVRRTDFRNITTAAFWVGIWICAIAAIIGVSTLLGHATCLAGYPDYQPIYKLGVGCTVQSDFGGRIPAANLLVQ